MLTIFKTVSNTNYISFRLIFHYVPPPRYRKFSKCTHFGERRTANHLGNTLSWSPSLHTSYHISQYTSISNFNARYISNSGRRHPPPSPLHSHPQPSRFPEITFPAHPDTQPPQILQIGRAHV